MLARKGRPMKTSVYWKQLVAVAFLVMATGYWLMSAFTFTLPVWLVVPASTLGVLIFVDWLSGRFQRDEGVDLLRPVCLAALTLVGYALLTRLNFLPSSALLLAVLVSTILLDLVLGRVLGRTEGAPIPVRAHTPSA
jgi:hypothetical protein